MRIALLALLAACNGTPATPDDTDSGSDSETDTAFVLPPQQWYRLVEMSGETTSATYETQMVDGGLGPVPQYVRGYLYIDEEAHHMDIRMTLVNGGYTTGVISGEGTFGYEEDGAKIVLTRGATWVYHVTRDGGNITLAIAKDDPRNQASQSTLDTYSFVLEDIPPNPLAGDWVLQERVTVDATQGLSCGPAQNMVLLQLYGTADGTSSFNPWGGLENTLNLALWDNNTCSNAPIMDLQMYGSGFCEIRDADGELSCFYPRYDQSGNNIRVRYEGRYTVDGDTLDIAVSSFQADSTDPELRHLTYTRAPQ